MNRALEPSAVEHGQWRRIVAAAGTAVVVGAGVLLGPVMPASAARVGQVSERGTGITAGSGPEGIAAGPDGNMWFTESNTNKIARMTPAGVVHEFGGLTGTDPTSIAAGPGGYMWFTEYIGKRVGRINTRTGVVNDYLVDQTGGNTQDITLGPDGNMWFTELTNGQIGKINTSTGAITEYVVGGQPYEIVAGRDGKLWFTEYGANRIGRITTSGVVTHSSALSAASSHPNAIAAGPDGNLWFTEDTGNKIGRITTSMVITEFGGVTANAQPRSIAAGPDGNLWFTEANHATVARITTAGVVTEFSSGISTNALPWGIARGPDGNMWFTEYLGQRIGRIGTGFPPTMTCKVKGGTDKPKLKVICHITAIKPSATVQWKVKRHGLVAKNHTKLKHGKLVINLSHVAVHKGKNKVTVTTGTGINKYVLHQTVRVHKK